MEGKSEHERWGLLGDSVSCASFQQELITWFRAEGRDYPWRGTSDPYAIFVSEAMLQQTRIATVLGRGYFSRWMKTFPTWKALASAKEVEVLKLWEGLGYYNRARNLHKTATLIVNGFAGVFPSDPERILSLPGVGRYTAGAVLSFAFNKRAAIVDGNVIRVFSRLILFEDAIDSAGANRHFWEIAECLTPGNEPGLYNAAIMELGQRICLRSSPDCEICPVKKWCLARSRGLENEIPLKRKRAETILREERVVISLHDGRILLQPETGSRRRGLWRLPEISSEASEDLTEVLRFQYSITRYRVTLMVFVREAPLPGCEEEKTGGSWFDLAEERALPPLGSPYRKALRMMSLRGMF